MKSRPGLGRLFKDAGFGQEGAHHKGKCQLMGHDLAVVDAADAGANQARSHSVDAVLPQFFNSCARRLI